uniref:Neuromast-expressed gpi-anchored lymphocyte antigen 6 n=1 Tax=Sphaeramia orbicularis TaxID=375764 RepID=A0A673AVW0_9TELE
MLKCYHCKDTSTENCSDNALQRECPSGSDRCMALRVTTFTGKEISKIENSKSCAPASLCVEGSINLGTLRAASTTKCCSTNLCNDQLAPEPAEPRPNGKKCFGCDGTEFCNQTLDCVDDEDNCFTNIGFVKVTTKGCITKEFCQKTHLAELSYEHNKGMTCCQGDYCNRADSTGSSLLLLVATGFPRLLLPPRRFCFCWRLSV